MEDFIDSGEEELEILGLKFVETSFACPEQYDVYDKDGRKAGYVRLRWAHLRGERVEPEKTLYTHDFGDEWLGLFPDDERRNYHLTKIAEALIEDLERDCD